MFTATIRIEKLSGNLYCQRFNLRSISKPLFSIFLATFTFDLISMFIKMTA